MTFRNLAAVSAVVALGAIGSLAFAQDDLDDLLNDLEVEASSAKEDAKPAAAPAAPAESVEAAESEEIEPEIAETIAEVAPAAEEKAEEAVAEVAPAVEEKAEEVAEAAEEPVEEKAEEAAPAVASKLAGADSELLENIRATEELRRQAYDAEAKREIREARECLARGEPLEAARHYTAAGKLLNDSPRTAAFRKECTEGRAKCFYDAALTEYENGRRSYAKKLMTKARDLGHPSADAKLVAWQAVDDPNANNVFDDDIRHRRNEEEFKKNRARTQKLLKRARQLLAVNELDKAQEECERVLAKESWNKEALRLRKAILKKQASILDEEFEVTREGMIDEVGRKWRPVYAPNVREIDEVAATTVKRPLGEDPERAHEQLIIKRMKDIRLPTIQFKPPATIIDAVEFFRGASKDFDNPEIPVEKRGFNFVLKTPTPLNNVAAPVDDGIDFGAEADDDSAASGASGVPVIPMITASDISFYDALKLVCDSVDYKFKVRGPVVMVMHKSMTSEEMITRSYPVMSAFSEKMNTVSSEMKEMRTGFGNNNGSRSRDDDEEGSKDQDWKRVFSELGVQWPEGSSIYFMKATGKLRVKNTYENLAELEKALIELNAEQKLVEIEARFVEVCQEDLNSLGFEWILNSDYTIGGGWLANKLGFERNGGFTEGWTTSKNISDTQVVIPGGSGAAAANTYANARQTTTTITGTGKNVWSRTDMYGNALKDGLAGLNAFGGGAEYGPNNRYLSTLGNHIAGEGKAINDQFMRVNAFLGNADLSMILHMLSQRSDTDLLSSPKVLTRPGEEAVIKVVTEYIYPTDYDVQLQSSSSSSGGSSSGGSSSAILAVVEPQSFTMREVGVILDVTPTLTDDGNLIDLKLSTQVVDEPQWKNYGMKIPFTGNSSNGGFDFAAVIDSLVLAAEALQVTLTDALKTTLFDNMVTTSLDSMQKASSTITYYDAPMEQPFFHVRSIESNISIYPGATIVMGGLITEERKAMDDKVPFLGDLPFIGRLFRSHSEWTSKRNLLIFVTTRLVDVRGREVTIGGNDVNAEAEVKSAPAVED